MHVPNHTRIVDIEYLAMEFVSSKHFSDKVYLVSKHQYTLLDVHV